MQKETRITPSKERLKTTWITHAFQVQNKAKPTDESESLFPILMNNIYSKEQYVSREEKDVKSNARNTNFH